MCDFDRSRCATARRAFAITALVALASSLARPAPAATIPPITSGYGADGPFSVDVQTFSSPLFLGRNVSVFLPDGATGPVPTIFFAHGFDGDLPIFYNGILNHLATRGYGAVFSPYTSLGTDQALRYAQMFAGFKKAFTEFPTLLDPTRVGFVGHSLGGGALPALALQGLVNEGWGGSGAFLYNMAPWYSYEVSQAELETFPSHVKMIMQIFDDDRVNDHRMAIDLFENINIPDSEKDFITTFSDSNGGMLLDADHFVPLGATGSPQVDGLDFYGIHRLIDALADYTFTGNLDGKNVALGGGSPEQTFMGEWPDTTPVTPLAVTDDPVAAYAQNQFLFRFNSLANPRFLVPEPTTAGLLITGGIGLIVVGIARRRRS